MVCKCPGIFNLKVCSCGVTEICMNIILQECFKWGEVYLNEALNHYRGALNLEDSVADRTKWCNVITNTLQLLLCSIDEFGLNISKYTYINITVHSINCH